MQHGKFISIEGIEGVGKSTAVSALTAVLQAQSIPFICTREPGGTPAAEAIRGVLLDPAGEALCDDAELLLMFAARAQHVETVIKPALQAGTWVISDRFVDASFAYQGGGRGMSMDKISMLQTLVLGEFLPDLTLLLDAPLAVCLDRLIQRGEEKDRIEQEQQSFFEAVRKVYVQRAEDEPNRFVTISSSDGIDATAQRIQSAVMTHFALGEMV